MLFLLNHLSNVLFLFFIFRCDDCKESNREHCYHWFVGDELSIATFQADLEAQLDAYIANSGISFDDIKSKTKIKYDPCNLTRESCVSNIDFIPHGETE